MPLPHRWESRPACLHDTGAARNARRTSAGNALMGRSIVIVGAGPAGMATAIEAVTSGCRVTVVDEAMRPGGQIYRQSHPALDGPEVAEPAELTRKRRILDGFERILDRVDYR